VYGLMTRREPICEIHQWVWAFVADASPTEGPRGPLPREMAQFILYQSNNLCISLVPLHIHTVIIHLFSQSAISNQQSCREQASGRECKDIIRNLHEFGGGALDVSNACQFVR
jgi:hypothetical protein